MFLRNGRYGDFYACARYPSCRYTRPKTKPIGVKCPKCGDDVVSKWGKNHTLFYSCVRYPDCDFSSWDLPTTGTCPKCGGMVRPDVTLYGEFLPKEAHDKARRLIRDANLLIIGGTSLQVGSAAGLARQFSGGRLVIINKSRTLMDGAADLVFHDSIGKILSEVNLCTN